MPFRDRVRKALRRTSGPKDDGKPKIEYYRRGEVPRSKYRGPVDPEHRRQLYAWNFADATEERNRSFELDLSPCTSLPDNGRDSDEEAMDSDPFDDRRQRRRVVERGSITIAHHEVAPSGSFDSSPSSTLIDSESSNSSFLTLKDSWDWPMSHKDVMSSMKGAIAGTADAISRRTSAPEKRFAVAADDLTRALNTVQIC